MIQRPSTATTIVGDSASMRRLLRMVCDVARLDSPVLITGESGTGKELVAQILHATSARGGGPFVPINVGAVPESLLESQLFGHVKGAFTDARENRDGLVTAAHGGTLFLDEIGEMPLSMQVKVLRVLEDRRVRPVGRHDEIPVNFRLVSATHRDLEEAVAKGQFRRDLYHRVDVIQIDVPPLRERGDDIILLADHFLAELAARFDRPAKRLSHATRERLLRWHWPGNVRELKNCIEHAVGLARTDELGVEDLPRRIRDPNPAGRDADVVLRLDDVERQHVLRVLKRTGGNRLLAAKLLGISRRTLYRRLDEWGVVARLPAATVSEC